MTYANEKNHNMSCAACGTTACRRCHGLITAEGHVCNPDDVASLEKIKAASKPCPSCRAPIEKSEGCSQMFCVACNTVFDFNTGKMEVVDGVTLVHTPHFFEWLASNREAARAYQAEDFARLRQLMANDNVAVTTAADLPDSPQLRKLIKRNNQLRLPWEVAKHILGATLPQLAAKTSGTALGRNLDLRIKYIDNELTAEQLASKIFNRDRKLARASNAHAALKSFAEETIKNFAELKFPAAGVELTNMFQRLTALRLEANGALKNTHECYGGKPFSISAMWVLLNA